MPIPRASPRAVIGIVFPALLVARLYYARPATEDTVVLEGDRKKQVKWALLKPVVHNIRWVGVHVVVVVAIAVTGRH